jgi:hypothetical protein
MPYDPEEQNAITSIFAGMLDACTKDGGLKRASGAKVDWRIDMTHEAALFSHLNKWKHGEVSDADSGAHPLVHLAWRALAIAYQETDAAELEALVDHTEEQWYSEMDAYDC